MPVAAEKEASVLERRSWWRRRGACTALAVVAVLGVLAGGAAGQELALGKAQGTVTVNGPPVTVVAAYARVNDEGYVEVALVDRPLRDDLLDPEIPFDRAQRLSQAEGLRFTITREGASRWMVSTGGCGAYCEPTLVFEPSGRSEREVAGRAFTRDGATVNDQKVQFDVRFRAEVKRYVEPPPRPGQEAARRSIREMGHGFNRRDYFFAARSHPEQFDAFVRAGMPVDAEHPEHGWTMLAHILDDMRRCDDQPHGRIVAVLLAMGADPNQVERQFNYHQTVLMKAYPCVEHMDRLIAAGARLDAPTGWRKPPWTTGRELMASAIADGDEEVVDFLIGAGFDVKPDGPALLKAATGKPAILKSLRAAGARAATTKTPPRRAK
jgi:hypothetical protein